MSDQLAKTRRETSRHFRLLTVLAAASALVYACIAFLSWEFDFDGETTERPIVGVLLLFAAAFVGYLFAIRVATKAPQTKQLLRLIVWTAIIFRVTLLFSVPIQEIDIYRYLWDGAATTAGVSPFRYSPAQVRSATVNTTDDRQLLKLVRLRDEQPALAEILDRVHFGELPTIYPPTSQFVFAAAAFTSPADAPVLVRVFIMKAWFVAFDLATLFVIIALLRLCRMPIGLCLIYAWCPLLMKEVANSGHLDAVAVFLTTLAIYLAVRLFATARMGLKLIGDPAIKLAGGLQSSGTSSPLRTQESLRENTILARRASEGLSADSHEGPSFQRRQGDSPSPAHVEVEHVLSPVGTAVDSLGRKPQENRTGTKSSPEGATEGGAFKSVSPLQGSPVRLCNNSWGSRPRLSAVAASRLKSATSKLARRAGVAFFTKRDLSISAQATLAFFVLALAIGAKLYPVILVPLFVLVLAKHLGWRCLLIPSATFAVATAVLVAPMLPKEADSSAVQATRQDNPPLPTVAQATATDPSRGVATFLRHWEMNDFIFLVIVENLKPTDDLSAQQLAWFSVVPNSVRQRLTFDVSERFGVTPTEVPFLITRAITALLFFIIAIWLAWRATRKSGLASFCEAGFLTIAWFWLLCPTQNPWYWTWALPLLPFARSRAWLAVSGLVLIYYLRFWLSYHWPESPVLGTGYVGYAFFDFIVTWIEFAPWFGWLCLGSFLRWRRSTNSAANSATHRTMRLRDEGQRSCPSKSG